MDNGASSVGASNASHVGGDGTSSVGGDGTSSVGGNGVSSKSMGSVAQVTNHAAAVDDDQAAAAQHAPTVLSLMRRYLTKIAAWLEAPWKLLAAALVGALITGVATIMASSIPVDAQKAKEAEARLAAERFERSRIDSIKQHILNGSKKVLAVPDTVLPPIPRLEALLSLNIVHVKAGIYALVGPKGEGKSKLAQALARLLDHAIYVDLQQDSIVSNIDFIMVK